MLRLKAMGANTLRCAHNAPAAELLDAADRHHHVVLGVLSLGMTLGDVMSCGSPIAR